MNNKRFERDSMNKVIAGVCSGLANYFNLDVALVRVFFVTALLFASFGFWLYVILWIVIPADNTQQATIDIQQTPNVEHKPSTMTSIFAGAFVILIGILFLINNFLPIMWVWKLWPLILVGIGTVMIYKASKKGDGDE